MYTSSYWCSVLIVWLIGDCHWRHLATSSVPFCRNSETFVKPAVFTRGINTPVASLPLYKIKIRNSTFKNHLKIGSIFNMTSPIYLLPTQ